MKIKISKTKLALFILVMGCVTYSTAHAQSKIYDITKYGAKSNIESLQTEYIQAAIDAASKKGGGKVIIPKGSFVSGSIILKSNIELHMEEGAILLGSL
ncbi:MAG: hypothetical protein NWS46_03870, partial [Cyclobacteriaceae bacterium]|nr:hypothetical protein [Cyclobacteriaceae bacterium]